VAILLLSEHSAQAVYYNAVVLTNSSFPGAQAFALNDNNQVTGYYFDHVGSGHYEQPFVYNFSTNTFSALPGFSNTSNYIPTGINNSGLIVGSDGTTNKGFVDNGGTVTEVAPLAGSTLTFSSVNSNGLAVGTSTTATAGVTRAVVYNPTSLTLTDVGSGFSGPSSAGFSNTGYGINASGQVEGLGVDTGGTSTAANANAIAQPFIATPTGSGTYTYKNVGNVIDPTDSSTYSQFAGGIDAQGNLTGSVNSGGTNNETAYFYNASTSTYAILAGNPSDGNVIAEVNGTPALSGTYYPLVEDPTGAYTHSQGFPPFLYTNGTLTDLYSFAPGGVSLGNPLAINSNGSILFAANSATAGAVTVLLTIDNTQVVYTGASSNSWDTTSANFSPSNYADGDLVVFNDSATGSTSITIPSRVTPQGVTFNNSSKAYVVSGAAIAGAGTYLTVAGGGQVTLNNANTYTGPTNVSAGTLIISPTGSIASSDVSVSAGAMLNVQNSIGLSASQTNPPALALSVGGTVLLHNYGSGSQVVFGVGSLSISGSTNAWAGKLDLANNDLVAYRGSLSKITNQVKSGYAGGTWQGNGITSSAAAADTTHLTALGVIQDTVDGVTTNGAQLYTTFNGVAVYSNDVLIGYTYYGDANLDGQVDGLDYTQIDNAYLNNQTPGATQMTGWYNGDFNYDGIINGSDYTLIDNAFNAQGANLGGGSNSDAELAQVTAQISESVGTAAVPEPGALSLLGVTALWALRRRPRAQRPVSDGEPLASKEY
jgi:autotransporter-associated beta strand protein